ncbi:MAG TPA: S8 family serine peptidase [Acidimicrobiia bacterium]
MKRLLIVALASVTAFAMALPVIGQSESARSPQGVSGSAVGGPVDLDQEARLFVQLDEPSVSEFVASSDSEPSAGAQKAQANRVKAQQDKTRAEVEAAGADVVSKLVVGANGFVVNATLRSIPQLEALSGVKSVARVTVFSPSNETSVPWIGAPAVWDSGYTGTGISVGIIDTGIDYYHANFGGSGDPADFAADDGLDLSDGNFPNVKVLGGWDFVGDDYNADPTSATYQPTPHPDPDPLDCQGHGSHVGGSAAGLGVPGIIGPGVAPDADVYALRVFGCDGSTDVVSAALEWAMDPNGDGSMDDHLDVINMSLGSPFGSPDDPSAISTANAVAAGVVVVASAGNEGDAAYVTGSPAISPNAISVAASVDGGYAILGINYTVDGGDPVPVEAAEGGFTPPLALVGPVIGNVVTLVDGVGDTNDGCEPAANAADIAGNIALVERGICDFVVKVANAEAAGAIATIVFNDAARGDALLNMGGSGSFNAPSVFVGHTDGQAMSDAYTSGSVVEATLSADILIPKPELADTLADFTSRGPGFANTFKPDVAAPGFGINSTNVGTGTLGGLNSGTSMASPHVAGMAALLLDKDSSLSPAAVKALIQNSTTPAVGDYPLARQGVGVVHVDVAAELGSYAMPGGLSFGRVDSRTPSTVTREVEVTNMTGSAQTYTITHESLHGVAGVTVASQSNLVTVGAHSSKTVRVGITVDPAAMTPDDNFFSQTEVDGWFVFTSSSDTLRVGYLGVVDPGAGVDAEGILNNVVVSNNSQSDGVAEGFTLIGQGAGTDAFSISKLGARTHDLYGFPVVEFGFETGASWPTFSPYEMDIYIDDDPATDCDGFGNETVIVAADLGVLTGGDPTSTVVTGVFNLCDGSFPLDFFAGIDYNDGVGVLTDDPALVFPYDGDGVFSYEAYTFDYYTSGIDFVGGSVDLGAGPSAAVPSVAVAASSNAAIGTIGNGQMLWLFPNNSAGDQARIVRVKDPRWLRLPF